MSGWTLVREAVVLLSLWAVALYIVSRSGGDVSGVALGLAVGCFIALVGGAALEALVMKKSWTLVVGCLVLALWGIVLPIARTGGWLVIPGLLGLLIVAMTPGAGRARDAGREKAFLAGHPRWRVWRHRLRRALVLGMILGIGITVLAGLWNSIAGV